MTMLWIDMTSAIIDVYREDGYQEVDPGPHHGNTERRVLRKGEYTVLVAGPVTIRNPLSNLEKTVDETIMDATKGWFKRLEREAKGLAQGGHRKIKIVFQGGGSIPIPGWFEKMCSKQGIEIEVLGPEGIQRKIAEMAIGKAKDLPPKVISAII